MADFKYLTRESTSPQGKPAVYFTAHPADQGVYLKSIAQEILNDQNCALYYLDGEVNPKDRSEYEFDLLHMQLLVVPVTSRLLTTANRAMDVDVPFALSHNIPVLPLVQEKNLEEQFGKKFGDLQFLDATSTDSTAIDFSDKLANYLDAVLVGDDLAREVRAAFDAYIFLSYRKKDRQQANELMRLIHQDPRCRSIAIWYDEFLTPGESFNDAIKNALENSDLFALAITPNIIKGDNYVLSTEYPLAKKLDKSILPVEMVSTWRWNLTRKLKGLPDIIDGNRPDLIATRTIEAITSLPATGEDDDPQHRFFIGLAYLSGIDVEVDQEYGVKMISSSADDGCLEAIQKLVWMYNTGDGVARDYDKAIEWQEKLIAALKDELVTSDDPDIAATLFEAMRQLAQFNFDLRRFDKAEDAFNELLGCVKGMSLDDDDPLRRYVSTGYDGLGRIADALNDTSTAADYYEKGREVCEVLADSNDDIIAQSDLSVTFARIAGQAFRLGNYDTAEENYSAAIKIIEHIVEQDDSPWFRKHLYGVLEGLGNTSCARGNYELAAEYFERGYDVCKEVVAETEDAVANRDLGVFLERLGSVALAMGDATTAEDYFRTCLELREDLVDKTNAVEVRSDLDVVCDKLGDIAASKGDQSKAERLYRKSFDIAQKLVAETNTIQARRSLGASYIHLGNIALRKRDTSTAEQHYLKGIEISQSVIEESGFAGSGNDLAMGLFNLAVIKFSKKDWNEARILFAQAVKAGEENLTRSNDMVTKKTFYAICDNAARMSHEIMDLFAAEEYYRKACEVSEQIVAEADTEANYLDLAKASYHVSEVGGRKRDYEETVAVLKRVIAKYPSLYECQEMLDEAEDNLRKKR